MFELIHSLALDLAAARATAWAEIPADVPWLADHFPGAPVLPGTLAAELCAQAAGPLAEETLRAREDLPRFAVLVRVKDLQFLRPVELPALVRIDADLLMVDGVRAAVAVVARAADVVMLQGKLHFAMVEDAPPAAVAARRARLARWGAAGT